MRNPSGQPAGGKGSKPRVDVARRREDYIRIASQVFLEKGLHKATMQDVADAAGAPKVLIYRIFPSKKALLDAILEKVLETIHEVWAEPNFIYGSRVRDMARAAQPCPEPYLLVFRYSRAGVEYGEWAEAITAAISAYTRDRWFKLGQNAPAGAERRAEFAARLAVGPFIDMMIRWIEDGDGLDEETRLRWWARIQREYHLASREAFRLGTVEQSYTVPGG